MKYCLFWEVEISGVKFSVCLCKDFYYDVFPFSGEEINNDKQHSDALREQNDVTLISCCCMTCY